ncbi:putative leucine-rich repeat-containing protein DDB_G0290503 isoform X1 [Onthophagus taurus]|uniref:putative leucine-rich repeat-containing protein DDB_G0290503 isoform X1 n=1 Tax=Onthophagus taurus TaxID=166361 RepID=UPI0039BE6CEF
MKIICTTVVDYFRRKFLDPNAQDGGAMGGHINIGRKGPQKLNIAPYLRQLTKSLTRLDSKSKARCNCSELVINGRALHYVVKVDDRSASLHFYTDIMGMKVLRNEEVKVKECKCDQPYQSKTVVGYGLEDNYFCLQLTYDCKNQVKQMKGNECIGITVIASQALEQARKLNWPIHSYNMLEAPDGLKVYVIDSPLPRKSDPIVKISLACTNLTCSLHFWHSMLGLTLFQHCKVEKRAQISFRSDEVLIELHQVDVSINRGQSADRIVFSCPLEQLYLIQSRVSQEFQGRVVIPLTKQEHDGLQFLILADPDGHEVCFVDDLRFRQISRLDPEVRKELGEICAKSCFEEDVKASTPISIPGFCTNNQLERDESKSREGSSHDSFYSVICDSKPSCRKKSDDKSESSTTASNSSKVMPEKSEKRHRRSKKIKSHDWEEKQKNKSYSAENAITESILLNYLKGRDVTKAEIKPKNVFEQNSIVAKPIDKFEQHITVVVKTDQPGKNDVTDEVKITKDEKNVSGQQSTSSILTPISKQTASIQEESFGHFPKSPISEKNSPAEVVNEIIQKITNFSEFNDGEEGSQRKAKSPKGSKSLIKPRVVYTAHSASKSIFQNESLDTNVSIESSNILENESCKKRNLSPKSSKNSPSKGYADRNKMNKNEKKTKEICTTIAEPISSSCCTSKSVIDKTDVNDTKEKLKKEEMLTVEMARLLEIERKKDVEKKKELELQQKKIEQQRRELEKEKIKFEQERLKAVEKEMKKIEMEKQKLLEERQKIDQEKQRDIEREKELLRRERKRMQQELERKKETMEKERQKKMLEIENERLKQREAEREKTRKRLIQATKPPEENIYINPTSRVGYVTVETINPITSNTSKTILSENFSDDVTYKTITELLQNAVKKLEDIPTNDGVIITNERNKKERPKSVPKGLSKSQKKHVQIMREHATNSKKNNGSPKANKHKVHVSKARSMTKTRKRGDLSSSSSSMHTSKTRQLTKQLRKISESISERPSWKSSIYSSPSNQVKIPTKIPMLHKYFQNKNNNEDKNTQVINQNVTEINVAKTEIIEKINKTVINEGTQDDGAVRVDKEIQEALDEGENVNNNETILNEKSSINDCVNDIMKNPERNILDFLNELNEEKDQGNNCDKLTKEKMEKKIIQEAISRVTSYNTMGVFQNISNIIAANIISTANIHEMLKKSSENINLKFDNDINPIEDLEARLKILEKKVPEIKNNMKREERKSPKQKPKESRKLKEHHAGKYEKTTLSPNCSVYYQQVERAIKESMCNKRPTPRPRFNGLSPEERIQNFLVKREEMRRLGQPIPSIRLCQRPSPTLYPTPKIYQKPSPTLYQQPIPTLYQQHSPTLYQQPSHTLYEQPSPTLCQQPSPILYRQLSSKLYSEPSPKLQPQPSPTKISSRVPLRVGPELSLEEIQKMTQTASRTYSNVGTSYPKRTFIIPRNQTELEIKCPKIELSRISLGVMTDYDTADNGKKNKISPYLQDKLDEIYEDVKENDSRSYNEKKNVIFIDNNNSSSNDEFLERTQSTSNLSTKNEKCVNVSNEETECSENVYPGNECSENEYPENVFPENVVSQKPIPVSNPEIIKSEIEIPVKLPIKKIESNATKLTETSSGKSSQLSNCDKWIQALNQKTLEILKQSAHAVGNIKREAVRESTLALNRSKKNISSLSSVEENGDDYVTAKLKSFRAMLPRYKNTTQIARHINYFANKSPPKQIKPDTSKYYDNDDNLPYNLKTVSSEYSEEEIKFVNFSDYPEKETSGLKLNAEQKLGRMTKNRNIKYVHPEQNCYGPQLSQNQAAAEFKKRLSILQNQQTKFKRYSPYSQFAAMRNLSPIDTRNVYRDYGYRI